MTHAVFSAAAINKHADRWGDFHSHFASLSKWFMCLILTLNKTLFYLYLFLTSDTITGLGDLREDPLQPPSCGADDFSKCTERLTQEVLWRGNNKENQLHDIHYDKTPQCNGYLFNLLLTIVLKLKNCLLVSTREKAHKMWKLISGTFFIK